MNRMSQAEPCVYGKIETKDNKVFEGPIRLDRKGNVLMEKQEAVIKARNIRYILFREEDTELAKQVLAKFLKI